TEMAPLKSLRASEACDALIKIFTSTAIPNVIQSDRGTNLIAGLTAEVYKRLGVEMRKVSPLHPEGNAGIDRFNATAKTMLHHLVTASNRPRDWDRKLDYVMWAYRETEHKTIKISPY